MNVREEILQHLEKDVAKYIENSTFLTYACELASYVREDYLLEALLKELAESAYHLGRSKLLRDLYHKRKDEALMFDAYRANYCACLHAYRAALLVTYAKRNFHHVYLLARIPGWHYPEDILGTVLRY